MKVLPFALSLLGILLSSCSVVKNSYDTVARGTGAAWGAVADAGGSVVSGTADIGKKTTKLVTGGLGGEPKFAEMTVAFDGKRGAILIALDDDAAPGHSKNFRKLAKDGYYNGLGVHRAVPGHLIQTGDPRSKHENARAVWGLGGPGYTVPAEIKLPHLRGSVGMARLGDRLNPTRQSNGSQFYICLKPMPELNGNYTVFGKVVAGLEVADAISRTSTDDNDAPLKMVKVEKIRLLEDKSAPIAAAAPAPAAEASPTPVPAPAPKSKRGQAEAAPAEAPLPAPVPEKKKGWMGRMLEKVW